MNKEEEIRDVREAIARAKAAMVTEPEARKIIVQVIERNRALINAKGEHAANALMGDAMQSLRGKIAGDTVSMILQEELEKIVEKMGDEKNAEESK